MGSIWSTTKKKQEIILLWATQKSTFKFINEVVLYEFFYGCWIWRFTSTCLHHLDFVSLKMFFFFIKKGNSQKSYRIGETERMRKKWMHLRFHDNQPDNHIPNQLSIYSFQTVQIQQYHPVVEYLKLALEFVINMPYRWNHNTCIGKIPANLEILNKIRHFCSLKAHKNIWIIHTMIWIHEWQASTKFCLYRKRKIFFFGIFV